MCCVSSPHPGDLHAAVVWKEGCEGRLHSFVQRIRTEETFLPVVWILPKGKLPATCSPSSMHFECFSLLGLAAPLLFSLNRFG